MQKQNYEIFISGLPYSSKEEEIEEFFKGCGKILKINLPRYHDSGRLRGYGHVTFKTKKGLTKALEKNQQYLGTRYINVELAKPIEENNNDQDQQIDGQYQLNIFIQFFFSDKQIPKDCNTIFVKGIPYDYTEDDVGEFFMNCGEIENIRIAYQDSEKTKSKGFCYVEFSDSNSIKNALKLNGKLMNGRKIFVDVELNKAKKGYKMNMGEGNSKFCKDKNQILQKKISKSTFSPFQTKNIQNFAVQKFAQAKKKKSSKMPIN